jgi:nucleotide-binding universal stress UspA family protein
MNTIVTPLDGSELAEHALPYTQLLGALLKAQVVLLRAVTDEEQRAFLLRHAADIGSEPLRGSDWPEDSSTIEALLRTARDHLAGHAADLRASHLHVEIDVAVGSAAECIVEAAHRSNGPLIVMATHGYSGMRRWALGSVADRAVHMTSAPVLLVRSGVIPAEPLALRRILVPLDGSAFSLQALPIAIELAACARAELILLQVVPPSAGFAAALTSFGQPVPISPELIAEEEDLALHHMQQMAARINRPDLAITPMVESGYPADVILDEAARCHVDLIIMATHGRSGLQRWTLGSVADKVLHASTTPVMLIRARAP